MEEDLLYQLALSKVPGIGPATARKLISQFGEAKAVFQSDRSLLARICNPKISNAIVSFHEFRELEKELSFLEKYAIRPLFLTDKNYPQRLLPYENIPPLLFYKGNTDLNNPKVLAIVGTRTPTEYGRQVAAQFIRDFASAASSGPLIISGLAYGIDAIAHQAALDNGLPTIGVLGHGLDRIYPQQHTALGKKMVRQGGLLTSFHIGDGPESHHFPLRNRMVAGMSDALLVVETDIRGGSMLTVDDALTYHKKVFAIPGRINDHKSSGCNALISTGKARLLTHARQLIEDLKWEPPSPGPGSNQTVLFPAATDESGLSDEERKLLQLLREKTITSLDEISTGTDGPPYGNGLALALLNLELQGWIDPLPGKRYQLRS